MEESVLLLWKLLRQLKVVALVLEWRLELLMVFMEARRGGRWLLHDAAVLRAAMTRLLMGKH